MLTAKSTSRTDAPRGPGPIRTDSLLTAKQALYHWSYKPIFSCCVEQRGIEPLTSCLPDKRSTKLSYGPVLGFAGPTRPVCHREQGNRHLLLRVLGGDRTRDS